MSLPPPIRELRLCYVTNRKALNVPAGDQLRLLLEKIENAAKAGVDCIQIREKDLLTRDLMKLVSEAVRRVPKTCRILVNDRLDVALAAGAGGVHLGEQSLGVGDARQFVKERGSAKSFQVGKSTHSLASAQAAEKDGAGYVIFGPVFATPSKAAFGLPQGLDRLAEVCRSVAIPVIAIGGISLENAGECEAAGAAGVAAIRLFQYAADVQEVVRALRAG